MEATEIGSRTGKPVAFVGNSTNATQLHPQYTYRRQKKEEVRPYKRDPTVRLQGRRSDVEDVGVDVLSIFMAYTR